MSRSTRHSAIFSICLALCVAGCNAQSPPAGQTATPVAGSAAPETNEPAANQATPAAPVPQAAQGATDEAAPTAEEVLGRLDEFYRKADGLTFDFSQTAFVNLGGEKNEMTTEMTIAAARPNRLAMRTKSGPNKIEIVCDGEHLYLSLPAVGRYVKSSAPATFDELIADPQFMMLNMMSGKGPCLELLASRPQAKLMEGITSAKYLGRETVDGRAAHHLGFEQPDFDWELWVAATGDPAVLKASLDMGKAVAQAGQGFGDVKMNIVQTYKNWQFGQPPAAVAFAFSPPANVKVAASLFDMPPVGQQEEASPLVGKPAPDVELELLDGKPFSLKSLRGRQIVMLDFWATWCGPCVEELPLLAKTAAQYREKGVAFYAVNLLEEAETIREFLAEKKLDLAVCLDRQGEAGKAYDANAIPMLVLIDKAGTVQSVHVGYQPDIETVLKGELDALLAGKNLAAEAQVEPGKQGSDAPRP